MSSPVTLYTTEIPKAMAALYPTLDAAAIVFGYQRATSLPANSQFIVYGFENVRQNVFVGGKESLGQDNPTFNFYFYGKKIGLLAPLVDTMVNGWHGFSGNLTPLLNVSKLIVGGIRSDFDETDSYHIIEVKVDAYVNILV